MATEFTENDVILNPIKTINILSNTSKDIESLLNSYQHLMAPYVTHIPLLDQSADFKNKLVYTRGMIQNISDPILYSSAVTLKHTATTETRTIPVMFVDSYTPPESWNILETSQASIAKHANESTLINCTPVPNETQWCQLEWLKQQSTQTQPIQVIAYSNASQLLINHVYIFYGVISREDSTETLHCLFFKEVTLESPLNRGNFDSAKASLLKIREKVFEQLLFCAAGDKLAAEYLLFNLISRNYARFDVTQLGKFSLNLIHVASNTSPLISFLFPQLLERFLYLPLSLSYLNEKQFLPKKDYSSEQLITGCLQVVDSTFILIDETRMENGRLSASGVAALAALTELITAQCVYYDFTYHKLPFNVDTPILVLTEGDKSLLPATTVLPLLPSGNSSSRPELTKSDLEDIRRYLTIVRTMDYNLDIELQDRVQEDWVELRKENKQLTADDLTRLLTIARYLSLSRGNCHLLKETWEEVKLFESDRMSRLKCMT